MRVVHTNHVYEAYTIPETDYCGFYETWNMASAMADMAVQAGLAQVGMVIEHEIWPA
jgi:hypothetical protein